MHDLGPLASENLSSENSQQLSTELNLKGVSFAKQGDHLNALLHFLRAVTLNPNNAKAWYNFGTSLTKVGKYDDQTLECFNKAIEIYPEDPDAWNNKGSILEYMGENLEAMTCYKRALEVRPGHERTLKNIGLLLIKLGHKREGEKYLKNVSRFK
jgi:tetratricopeptide (TPR) repeat protein